MSQIKITNLTFSYEGSYEYIFENVSFQIDTDWKLGFIGRNGRGKTTFLNLLLERYPFQGTITRSVNFSYFPFSIKDASMTGLSLSTVKTHTQLAYGKLGVNNSADAVMEAKRRGLIEA